jgi:hypothetical protein
MEERWTAPAWLRWMLLFAALVLVTAGLAIEWVRIADLAACADRALSEPIACPAPPPPYEIPLALAIDVVVVVIALIEIRGARR